MAAKTGEVEEERDCSCDSVKQEDEAQERKAEVVVAHCMARRGIITLGLGTESKNWNKEERKEKKLSPSARFPAFIEIVLIIRQRHCFSIIFFFSLAASHR